MGATLLLLKCIANTFILLTIKQNNNFNSYNIEIFIFYDGGRENISSYFVRMKKKIMWWALCYAHLIANLTFILL